VAGTGGVVEGQGTDGLAYPQNGHLRPPPQSAWRQGIAAFRWGHEGRHRCSPRPERNDSDPAGPPWQSRESRPGLTADPVCIKPSLRTGTARRRGFPPQGGTDRSRVGPACPEVGLPRRAAVTILAPAARSAQTFSPGGSGHSAITRRSMYPPANRALMAAPHHHPIRLRPYAPAAQRSGRR
jgi:hypothetical protein